MRSSRLIHRPRSPALRQSGRARWWLLGLFVVALAGGGGWWMHRQAGEGATAAPAGAPGTDGRKAGGPGRFGGSPAQPVSVGEVRREDVRVQVSAIGTLNARTTAVVRAQVTGQLIALHFKEGDEVKAGALLAEMDPRSYHAALGQVQGALARDEALLANARIDLVRYRDLQQQNSIASQQVDTQAALVRQLEGTVAADRAARDAAQLQLSYTRITAPISGRLGLRQADRGNVVSPGDANGIVTIAQVRPIDAVFSVPEGLLSQITPRLADKTPLPVELWDREMRQRLGTGVVSALDNAIDTTTGSIRVKAAFPNENGALFSNQFVNVKLQLDTLKNTLTVPATALQNGHVYLVKDDGTVAWTAVRAGPQDGDRLSVQGDLSVGAQVVTDGLDRLRDGAKVNVITPPVPGAAPVAKARRFDPSTLPPEVREKLAKMSPEERRAFITERRAKAAASAPALAASAPASAPESKAKP